MNSWTASNRCQDRPKGVATQLTDPVIRLEFQMIQPSGQKLPAVAEEFGSFLRGRIADWAVPVRATR
jgi:hypothetical protein